jgi:hypothetical protein
MYLVILMPVRFVTLILQQPMRAIIKNNINHMAIATVQAAIHQRVVTQVGHAPHAEVARPFHADIDEMKNSTGMTE